MGSPQKRARFLHLLTLTWLMIGLSGIQGCSTAITPPGTASKDRPESESLPADQPLQPGPILPTAKVDNATPPPIQRFSSPSTDSDASTVDQSDGAQPATTAPAGVSTTDQPGTDPPTTVQPVANGSRRGKKKTADVPATLKQIKMLRESANRAEESLELGKAFRDISKAWEAARAHPEDAGCRALAEQLAAEMKELTPRANDRFRHRTPRAPLVVE